MSFFPVWIVVINADSFLLYKHGIIGNSDERSFCMGNTIFENLDSIIIHYAILYIRNLKKDI